MTTRTRIAALAFALLVLLAAAPGAHAESSVVLARGFKPNTVFQQNEFDAVNAFNGNLMMNIPLGPEYKSNGTLSYQFSLNYNSHVWDLHYYESISYGTVAPLPQPLYFAYYQVEGSTAGYWCVGSCPFPNAQASIPSNVATTEGTGTFSGVESVPHGNAGIGWMFSLGTFDGAAYTSQSGTTSIFYPSMHAPNATNTSNPTVKYTNDGTYLRLRTIVNVQGVPAVPWQREIDFPDGTRKHYTCVAQCPGTPSAVAQEWNLDWISDPFGNVLLVEYNTPRVMPNQTWTWTFKEMTANNAEAPGTGQQYYDPGQSYDTIRTHHAYFSQPPCFPTAYGCVSRAWETRLDRLAIAAPDGRSAVYEFKYNDVKLPATVGIPWPDMDGMIARYIFELDPVTGKKRGRRIASALSAIALPDPAGATSLATPPAGPGTATAGVWQFRYYDDSNGYPDDPGPVLYGNSTDYAISALSGRMRVAKPPTGGGYRYEYSGRGYPTRSCRLLDGETNGVGFTGVSKRQQIDALENDVPNAAWFYVGAGWVRTEDFGGSCISAKEFVSAVIAPPTEGTGNPPTNLQYSRISLAFFTLRSQVAGVDYAHLGWPYTEQEMLCANPNESCNGGPDAKYLSTRIVRGRYSDFTADPANSVRRMFQRYLRDGEVLTLVTPLRSTYVRYESSSDECPDDYVVNCRSANLRMILERSVFHDDGDTYAETSFSEFDGLGHFRRVETIGNFQLTTADNLPAIDQTEDRLSITTWNPGVDYVQGVNLPIPAGAPSPNAAWFTERYATTAVRESGVTFTKQYDFDENRNFIRSVRSLKDTSAIPVAGNLDVLLRTDRIGQFDGSVRVQQSWFGGDGADLSTATYVKDTVFRYGSAEYEAYTGCDVDDAFLVVHTSTIDENTGLPTAISDSSGATSSYTYDALSRVSTVKPPPATSTAQAYTYHYATQGRSGTEPQNGLPAYADSTLHITRGVGSDLKYSFDFLGRHNGIDETLPGGVINWTTFTYLPAGHLSKEATPIPNSSAASETKHFYDVLDRETQTSNPDGTRREFLYNGTRITTTKNHQVAVGVSGLSPVSTSEMRDVFGRIRRVNDNAARADYRYDAMNHLTRVELNEVGGGGTQVRWFTYDGRGFLTSETHPELGPGTVHHRSIDPLGHPELLQYPSDSSLDLAFTYDKAERLIQVKAVQPPITGKPAWMERFIYHPQDGSTVPSGTRAAGKLFKAVRRNFVPTPNNLLATMWVDVRKIYGYDDAGRVTSVTLESPYNGLFSATTTYHYDNLGQVEQIDYPAIAGSAAPSRSLRQTFSRGRLTAITATGNSNWSVATLGYHKNGMLSTITRTRPASAISSLVDRIEADPSGLKRPTRFLWEYMTASQTKSTADSGLYLYDGVSSIHTIGNDFYRYDSTYRLTSATVDGRTRTWGYDGFGNIISRPVAGDGSVVVDVNRATNRQTDLEYDKLGNVTKMPDARPATLVPGGPSLPTLNFKYDLLSAMTHYDANLIGRIFLYDADGERVATLDYKAGDALKEHWYVRGMNNQVLRDFDRTAGTWSWVKDYIYRGSSLLSTVGAGESLRDVHVDHLGTTRLVTAANGRPVTIGANTDSVRKYWPFGELLVTRTLPERQFFTGHERDDDGTDYPDADLDYMHARYYGAVAGRFLSLDPSLHLTDTIRSPQGWNRYAYALNSPLTLTDPTGRCVWDVCVAEAIALAAAVTATTAWAVAPSPVDGEKSNSEVASEQLADGAAYVWNAAKDLILTMAHRKGARPSTKGKHESGEARARRDRGGEKGDERRRPPRKRPPKHRGPWPPQPSKTVSPPADSTPPEETIEDESTQNRGDEKKWQRRPNGMVYMRRHWLPHKNAGRLVQLHSGCRRPTRVGTSGQHMPSPRGISTDNSSSATCERRSRCYARPPEETIPRHFSIWRSAMRKEPA